MNVLIALDSSATAQAALAATLARTWPEGSAFRVLTVLPLPRLKRDPVRRFDAERDRAHCLIDSATRKIEERNPDSIVVGEIDIGDPAKKIILAASSWPADLVVVGSHDRGPLERIFMGSVSRSVLKQAGCSVFIARNTWLGTMAFAPMTRVLLAIDSSTESRAAIDVVLRTHWPENVRFHVLSVVRPIYSMYGGWEPGALDWINYPDFEKEERLTRKNLVNGVTQELVERFGRSCVDQQTIAEGEPLDIILQAARAWRAGLIMVGSGEKRDFLQRLEGSVSQHVAMRADCSVQVIRASVSAVQLPARKQRTNQLRQQARSNAASNQSAAHLI